MTTHSNLFLGIDASTPWRAVGLSDGEGLSVTLNWRASRNEGRDLLPRIEGLLAARGVEPRDLAGIATAAGPGSFTSLRVGVSVAQGLGFGLGIPVVPIGSLESYPCRTPETWNRAAVVLPARSGEVFLEVFGRSAEEGWKPENVVECLPVEEMNSKGLKDAWVIGPALHTYEAEIRAALGEGVRIGGPDHWIPDGGVLAELGLQRWARNPDAFPAASVRIEYRQSHGALTTEERKGNV